MRRRGELSPRQVAGLARCHLNTVYGWIERSMAGEPSPLSVFVRRDQTGHYWVDFEAMEKNDKRG